MRLTDALTALPRTISDNGHIFINPATQNGFNNFRRSFSMVLRKANIREFTFHDLRHTYASWLVMAGTPLATVQKLMGHKTIAMTLRYAHLSPDHIRATVSVFDGKKPIASIASSA